MLEEKGVNKGIVGLTHLRLNGLKTITNDPTIKFCCRNRGLQVIELCRCRALTRPGIESIIKGLN